MALILASGDHHFDQHARFDECIRVHRWMVGEVERQRPAVFLSGGDVYERGSTPDERAAVAEWLRATAEVCPVVIAKGNHDRERDLLLLSKLRTKHPVIVEERCGVHVVNGIAVAVMAWPNRASLSAMLGKPLPPEALDDVARDFMRNVLLGLRQELEKHDGPRVLLGHFMVDGSVTSVGQPLIGAELNVGLADLALAGAPLVIASHIHKPQSWDHGAMEVAYCGSPFRTAFGETEEKSILRARAKGSSWEWDRIPTPATSMILLEAKWWPETSALGYAAEDEHGEIPCLNDRMALGEFKGAEVRLRYTVESDHREAAKRAAGEAVDALRGSGAVSVKLEERVVPTVRARAPEIASAVTLADQVAAMWKVRNAMPDAARKARLMSKIAQLEAEVGT